MNKKHFYSHLISDDKLRTELHSLHISEDEKNHLLTIASSNIHIIVLDTVLSQLDSKDKETFIQHLEADNHDKTWNFLKEKIEYIEEKIIQSFEELLKDLLSDIASINKKSLKKQVGVG